MSKVVCLINMKGGVGKTTLAVNLAASASWRDESVLVVDIDPQANASIYLLGAQGYQQFLQSNDKCIVDIFEQFTPVAISRAAGGTLTLADVVRPLSGWWTYKKKLDVIPSRLELAWTLKNPSGKEHLLARFLRREATNYDLIVIDCPPTESMFTTAAYLASEYILVPVVPEFMSAVGLPLLARSVDEFKAQYEKQDLEIVGIVFNTAEDNYPEKDTTERDVRNIASQNNWYVFQNSISYSRSYPRGPRARTPIFFTDYARDYIKDEFRTFASEFFQRIQL